MFHCIVVRIHFQRGGTARVGGALLRDVRQLVGEQAIACRRARLVVRGCDVDVTADGEGICGEGARRGIDGGAGMDARLAQVGAGCALNVFERVRRRTLSRRVRRQSDP
jgi:hypothetical protein